VRRCLAPTKAGEWVDKAGVPLAAIEGPRRLKQRNRSFVWRPSSVVAMENLKFRLIHDKALSSNA
jgi:hypothetical protein